MVVLQLSSTVLLSTTIATLGSAGIFGYRYWNKRLLRQAFKSVPSPPQHWLLGNTPQVLNAVKNKQFFQLLFDWYQQYGPLYVFWLGNPMLVLSQPQVIEKTIINGMKDGSLIRAQSSNKAWNDLGGPILLGQTGSEWQWRRKAWNPEFTAGGLSQYIDLIDQACTQLTHKISTTNRSEAIQVDSLFVELTMSVIACLLVGIPVQSKETHPEGQPLDIPKVYAAMSVIGYRFLRLATGEKTWMKYLPVKSSLDYWRALRYLENCLKPSVNLALRLRDHPQNEAEPVSDLFQSSMIVRIAAKEPRYTQKTLIAEAIELLIAGTDTTAHALSFTVGELALNPDIFEKAQTIVDKVWQQHGAFTTDSLKELNYIRAIIKETLRLYSVASGSTALQATRETIIEGITIPAGTQIIWSMLGAGRDAEVYTQPEEFRPERWLESGKGSQSLPMIDFGSGYHRCLGEPLAMLEATVMLAQLLRDFTWEAVNGRDSLENLKQNLLIYPPDGMPLKFQTREKIPVNG